MIHIERKFTKAGASVYDTCSWKKVHSKITEADGRIVFELKDAEFPEHYSQTACDIVSSKYFRRAGVPASRHRVQEENVHKAFQRFEPDEKTTFGSEISLKQCIDRMVGHWTYWAACCKIVDDLEAFSDELKYMILHQMWSPNSPQWFNCGLNWAYGIKPKDEGYYTIHGEYVSGCFEQAHACFIQPIEDQMFGEEGIFDILNNEARIFKKGSGTGTNFSNLRAKGERLSGGGKSSGVLSYLKIFDSSAGSIKSGGTTRRSAKMVILDLDHPDIEEFITWKSLEETKVASMITGSKLNKRYLDAIVLDPRNDKLKALALRRGIESNYIGRAVSLGDMGYKEFPMALITSDFNGEGYSTISGQNSNNTVSIPDAFFKCLESNMDWHLITRLPSKSQKNWVDPVDHPQGSIYVNGSNRSIKKNGKFYDIVKSLPSKQLMDLIAFNAWQSADPGVHFRTTINDWHTCLADGEIRSSNPCSEYLFLDNTACNLSSHRLTKHYDGRFNIETYKHAIRLSQIVLDLSVESALLPSKGIGEGTAKYRTTGNGYADIGAMLMKMGIAYDSETGRAWIAAMTSLLTSECYIVSKQLADIKGPYEAWERNKVHHMNVMTNHLFAAQLSDDINAMIDPDRLDYDLISEELGNAIKKSWSEAVDAPNGYRNAHVTVLAPTGCLLPDSMVITDSGLIRIGDLGNKNGDKWQDISFKVNNNKDATKFYVNGLDSCVTISTDHDYEISGTLSHKIKVLNENNIPEWKRLSDIKVGDIAPLYINGLISGDKKVELPNLPDMHWNCDFSVKVPKVMDKDLAELVGYFMGDGSLHSKEIRLCVTKDDIDVVERLKYLSKSLFNIDATEELTEDNYISVNITSVPLTVWWDACGFSKIKPDGHSGKGYTPRIPNSVLFTNNFEVYTSFLRGLFEADGTVNAGVQSLSTASKSFYISLKSMMLFVGLPTSRNTCEGGFSGEPVYNLRIPNQYFALRYKNYIGFISKRKSDKQFNNIPDSRSTDRVYVSKETFNSIRSFSDKHKTLSYNAASRGYFSRKCIEDYVRESGNFVEELNYFYSEVENISDIFESETFDISVPDGNTYIANGFISHNTIGIQMDCDTTGIEPDFSLKKWKKLSGGGYLTMVNQAVPEALNTLGYSKEQIDSIIAFYDGEKAYPGIDEEKIKSSMHVSQLGLPDALQQKIYGHGTLKGSILDPEHLNIFDCANDISWKGHVLAMAAAQPFLSGSISKTINMPNHANVEDIKQAFILSHSRALKCNAIYRDGSKLSQPLNLKLDLSIATELPSIKDELNELFTSGRGNRNKPPARRAGWTDEFEVNGFKYYLRHNIDANNKLCELWIDAPNESSSVRTALNTMCRFMSKGLQYGMPVEEVVDTLTGIQQDPRGLVKHENIKVCKSIYDAIGRFVAYMYLGKTDMTDVESEMLIDNIQPSTVVTKLNKTTKECPRCSSTDIVTPTSCKNSCKTCGHSWGSCGD